MGNKNTRIEFPINLEIKELGGTSTRFVITRELYDKHRGESIVFEETNYT